MTGRLPAIGFVFALAIVGGAPAAARAYPYFRTTSGTETCGACHVSPSGGGPLSEWGRGEAGDTLARGGRLYLPTGTIQYEKPILDAAHQIFGDHVEQVVEREFPLPDLVAKSKAVTQMVKDGFVSFRQRGSRWLWQLHIWRCERV